MQYTTEKIKMSEINWIVEISKPISASLFMIFSKDSCATFSRETPITIPIRILAIAARTFSIMTTLTRCFLSIPRIRYRPNSFFWRFRTKLLIYAIKITDEIAIIGFPRMRISCKLEPPSMLAT